MMPINPTDFEAKAIQYTAAWNSGEANRVAAHFSENGRIAINRAEPSIGTAAIADMAAGFLPMYRI